MKRIAIYIAVTSALLCLASCRNADKPSPFLKEKEMVDLLTDIRLTEAGLYNNRETNSSLYNEVMTEHAFDVYLPIFQKYGITYNQYMALMNYYMAHPEKLKGIYKKSTARLKSMYEDLQAADSIKNSR